MIIASFYRRVSTIVYIMLLIVIITTISVLNSLNLFLCDESNKIYLNSTRLIVSTDNDLYDNLNNNQNIFNIRRGVLLENGDDNTEFINDDPNDNYQISWTSFSYLSMNNVTAYLGESDLNNNEVEVGFRTLDYYNSTTFLDQYIGKTITTYFQGEKIELLIKRVYDAGIFPELKLSNSLFERLVKEDTKYFYCSQIKKEKYEEEIRKSLLEYKNKEEDKIVIPHIFSQSNDDTNYDIMEKINSRIKTLKIVTYILSGIFIIMFIIVSKNIVEDLDETINLEYVLGFNKKSIKMNLTKIMFSMYMITLLLANILHVLVVLLLNAKYGMKMLIINSGINVLILLVIIICNLLLIGTISNKLNFTKQK